MLPALAGLMLAGGGFQFALSLHEGNTAQRQVISEIHRLFPDPVPYFGRAGLISSCDRKGPFMSSWGLMKYRARQEPVFSKILREDAPPFLIENSTAFTAAFTENPVLSQCCGLLPEDVAALKEAYVRYSGPVWLLGQGATLGEEAVTLTVHRGGEYRLRADVVLNIAGRPVAPGEVVYLEPGQHAVSGPSGQHFVLAWATAQSSTPDAELPTRLFFSFWTF